MLGVVNVRTAGRFRVEPEPRIVQLLHADARSIKTHHRVFANQPEKLAEALEASYGVVERLLS